MKFVGTFISVVMATLAITPNESIATDYATNVRAAPKNAAMSNAHTELQEDQKPSYAQVLELYNSFKKDPSCRQEDKDHLDRYLYANGYFFTLMCFNDPEFSNSLMSSYSDVLNAAIFEKCGPFQGGPGPGPDQYWQCMKDVRASMDTPWNQGMRDALGDMHSKKPYNSYNYPVYDRP